MAVDRFDQYSQDAPRFSHPLDRYHWEQPSQPRPPQGTRWSMAPVPQASGAGGGTATRRGPLDRTAGEQFVERWRASEKRARRMAKAYGQPGVPQPWSGSPQDYHDATAGGRGGEMGKVLAKTPTPSPYRPDQNGHAPVGARPTPAPGGLSGGEAKVPAYAGT
jgi:hypothetical protein